MWLIFKLFGKHKPCRKYRMFCIKKEVVSYLYEEIFGVKSLECSPFYGIHSGIASGGRFIWKPIKSSAFHNKKRSTARASSIFGAFIIKAEKLRKKKKYFPLCQRGRGPLSQGFFVCTPRNLKHNKCISIDAFWGISLGGRTLNWRWLTNACWKIIKCCVDNRFIL